MKDEVFSFTSSETRFPYDNSKLISTKKGLACVWNYESEGTEHFLVWSFNWDKLKERKIDGFTGEIVVNGYQARNSRGMPPINIKVGLSGDDKIIKQAISFETLQSYDLHYTYTLISMISMKEFYDEMFLPSEKHDAVLEVDGKELHVNKTFLSYHSDFFDALFSSKFKEGQMSVIPIEDVTYEEIGLLFSAFYPKAIFPKDKTVPKLLELADRFLVPSVVQNVEYHLLNNTKIENEKLTWIADRYGMELLLEKMINQLDTVAKAKKLKASEDYMKLSDKTKAKILDQFMCVIYYYDNRSL